MAQKFGDDDAGGQQYSACLETCERYGEYLHTGMCTHVGLPCSVSRSNYSNSPSEDAMEVESCGDWKVNDVVDADQCLDWRDDIEDEYEDFSFTIVEGDEGPSKVAAAIVEPDDYYSEEYYEWNRVLEGKCPKDPLVNQPQVRCCDRAVLVAWLSKVIRSLNLFPETLFLTANIIDRFLVCTPIALECLQLLGLSAMFVAAKQVRIVPMGTAHTVAYRKMLQSLMLEISHPSVKELVKLGADAYSRQHFLQMERIILKRLQFHLVVATSLFFVEYYITRQSAPNNKRRGRSSVCLLERPHRMMVHNLAELNVQNYNLCRYVPSIVALSSMAVVEEYVSGRPVDLTDSRYAVWAHEPSLLKQCTTDIWSHLSRVLPGSSTIRDLSSDTFFERFRLPHEVT